MSVLAVLFTVLIQSQPAIEAPDLEQRVHTLVNSERLSRKVQALTLDGRLSKIARTHSEDMARRGFFNHVNPDGKSPRDRIRIGGYTCAHIVGENIYQSNLYSRVTISGDRKTYTWKSAEEIAEGSVKGWMQSSGHRQNILHRSYLKTGVGVIIAGNGEVFITQLFCG